MTITTNIQGGKRYPGNGVTAAFTVPWRVDDAAELAVSIIDDATYLETTPSYVVSGLGTPFATVTITPAPAVGSTVKLVPDLEFTQPVNLRSQRVFNPEAVEAALDRQTKLLAQIPAAAEILELIERQADPVGISAAVLRVDMASSVAGKGGDLVAYPDPVAPAFLKTTSDIINGERVSVLRGIAKAKHAGIRLNANLDDLSAGINDLLADMGDVGYGDLYVPLGTYHGKNLVVHPGTTIAGQGKGAIFKAVAGLANAEVLMANETAGSYVDNDIAIRNIAFDGNGAGARPNIGAAQARFTALVNFTRVTNLNLQDVVVRDTHYIGIATGACRYVTFTRVTGHSCGWDPIGGTTSSNGGDALWFGPGVADMNEDVTLRDCILRDNRWSAVTLSAKRAKVLGGHFLRNKEAHIFASRLLPNIDSEFLQIIGATFKTVTKQHISSSAVECGAFNLIFSGNTIEDCQHNGLALTDVHHATVQGNHFYDFGKELAANGSGVMILTTVAAPNQPKHITVAHNRIIDRQAVPTGYSGIAVVNAGAAVENVRLIDNDLSGWTQRGAKMIDIAAGKWGTGCERRGNVGTPDNAPVQGRFQPSAGTGAKTVTGIGFKPRRLELRVVQQASVTDATMSLGTVNAAGVAQCVQIEARVSATAGSRSGPAGSAKMWHMLAADGTIVADATFTSYDDDGFTYNVGTASAQPNVDYVAFP